MSLHTVNNFGEPDLRLSDSLFKVQETDQIVVRAEIISTTQVSSIWHHDNVSYSQHLEEDPFCKPEFEVNFFVVYSTVLYGNICLTICLS